MPRLLILIVLVVLTTLTTTLVIAHSHFHSRSRAPPPSLVTAQEFRAALRSSSSSAYFDNMGMADLQSRSCADSWEVRARIAEAQMEALDPQRDRLYDLARRADRLCLDPRGHMASPILEALPQLGWRFVILRDDVEGGMPHTLGDTHHVDDPPTSVVCLPESFFSRDDAECMRILIHEKIHVCQRARPDLCDAVLAEAGYRRHCLRRELPPDVLRLARSNPDLDSYIYSRPLLRRSPTLFLLSENPGSLSDGRRVALGTDPADAYEHPFEWMAHTLSESLL